MLNRLTSAAFVFAVIVASAGSAWADVAPDPTDPTEPVGMLLYAIVAQIRIEEVFLGAVGHQGRLA